VICSDSDDYNYDIEKDDLNTKYKVVVQSRMHLIAARPRLLPYFDMIRWALDHINLPSRTIVNDRQDIIGTFRPEHLQAMYKLPATSELTLGKEFYAEFKEKECTEFDQDFVRPNKGVVLSFFLIQGEQQRYIFHFFVASKLQVCGNDGLPAVHIGGHGSFLRPVGTPHLSSGKRFLIQLDKNTL
jgi:hypothetical protein